MPKFTNQNLIERFVNGNAKWKDESHTGNLWVDATGNRLMNYSTCLAQFHEGILYTNKTKYSVTTSKIQTWLYREAYHQFGACTNKWIEITEHVPFNTGYLVHYVPLTK